MSILQAGPTAREHLARPGTWRLHSLFASSANLERLPAAGPGAPLLLHLSPASAGLGSPFGIELGPVAWGRAQRALRSAARWGGASGRAGSREPRWQWDPVRGELVGRGAPSILLGAVGPVGDPIAPEGEDDALPTLDAAALARIVTATQDLARVPSDPLLTPDLVGAGAAGLIEGDLDPVLRLIGRGQGLTPSGDDAIIGALAVLRAAARVPEAVAAASPGPATGRAPHAAAAIGALIAREGRTLTTDVSCAYLVEAARGRFAAPTRRVLRAAAHGTGTQTSEALQRLLRVGHSSGADTLVGMTAAARAASARIAQEARG